MPIWPHYRRLLGRTQATLADRVPASATIKPSYVHFRIDLSAGLPGVVVEDSLTFHLTPCPCCGEPFAARLRITSRNNMFGPFDKERNGSTETIWPHEACSWCREDALNRERVARHRERHRVEKQPIACAHCGESFLPQRSTATFCSTKCRVAANRAAKKQHVAT